MIHKKRSHVIFVVIVMLLLVALPVTPAGADSAGPRDAGAGSNVDGPGTVAWSDPGNITAEDTSYASADLGPGATSEYLQGSNYGFSIPTGATIDGIQVTIMRQSSSVLAGNSVNDVDLYLLKAGAITGTNHAVATDWPTSMTAATYGDATDLWGTTWTPAEINAANFGVSLAVFSQSVIFNRVATVDYIQITVTYRVNTTTSVDCGSGTPVVTYGASITCVATASRGGGAQTPSGNVTWATTDSGTFVTGTCTPDTDAGTLTCTADYTPDSVGDGTHQITATYAGDTNFTGSNASQNLTVAKAEAVCTVTPYDVTYDGNPHTATGECLGVNDEVLSGLDLSGTTHTAAGSYAADPWTFTDVTGNYNDASGTVDDNIAPKDLTITGITADNKVYDGTTAATIDTTSATLVGVVGSDDVTLDTTAAVGTFSDPNVGTAKNVSVAGLALGGADAGNYTLTQPTTTADITPRPITVTADSGQSKVFGAADPLFTYTSDPLASGDTFSGVLSRVAGETVAGSPYPITLGTLSAGSNYSLTFVSADFTITPANTTISLASSANPSALGASVTFTATVAPAAATGTVQFYADGLALGSPAPLASGTASVSTATLAPGPHDITATYSGDSNFNSSSTAAPLVQTVGGKNIYLPAILRQSLAP